MTGEVSQRPIPLSCLERFKLSSLHVLVARGTRQTLLANAWHLWRVPINLSNLPKCRSHVQQARTRGRQSRRASIHAATACPSLQHTCVSERLLTGGREQSRRGATQVPNGSAPRQESTPHPPRNFSFSVLKLTDCDNQGGSFPKLPHQKVYLSGTNMVIRMVSRMVIRKSYGYFMVIW